MTAVESLGKHLLIRFDSGQTLRTHLGMNGAWHVYDAARSRPGVGGAGGPSQPSVLLETDAGTAVLFRARSVELTLTGAERTAHLGPDLLAADCDLDAVVRRARKLPPETMLGALLLDQRVAAGIGNIHRCELLWASLLSPWTPQGDLDDDALRDLYARAREGLARGVLSLRHRHAVHGRAGRPCPRCGTLISVRAQAQGDLARMTFWCPSCQPDPAPQRPARR